ncbi:MAG: TIGR00282 family metallophosphoesterase [Ktedonobacterales bacterium]
MAGVLDTVPDTVNEPLRLLFVGDVIGRGGRNAACAIIPELRQELRLDAVIVNCENSADNGFGATPQTARELLAVADFLTLGDHAFDQPDIRPFLDAEPRIIRPLNFADPVEGRGWGTFATANGTKVGVVNLLGSLFMRPKVTSPYAAADEAIAALHAEGAAIILVDMQAEATSEKQAMGWHIAGRATAFLGTHTHVPTADLRILPGSGTAYISDVGMTGARDGIIGYDRAGFLRIMVTGEHKGFPGPEQDGPLKLDAVMLEVDASPGPTQGQTLSAQRLTRER